MKTKITFLLLAGFGQLLVAADSAEMTEKSEKFDAQANAAIKIEAEPVKSWDDMSLEERKKYVLEARREELMMARIKPDPNEIICVSQPRIGSRVKRNTCKTRAEFRRERERNFDEVLASSRVAARTRIGRVQPRGQRDIIRPRARPVRPNR